VGSSHRGAEAHGELFGTAQDRQDRHADQRLALDKLGMNGRGASGELDKGERGLRLGLLLELLGSLCHHAVEVDGQGDVLMQQFLECRLSDAEHLYVRDGVDGS